MPKILQDNLGMSIELTAAMLGDESRISSLSMSGLRLRHATAYAAQKKPESSFRPYSMSALNLEGQAH